MKTNYVSAIVMLLAGGVYCLLGICYQIPLMDFLVQLLIVLLIFWIIGGIIRMVLDKFMGEIETKDESEETDSEEKEDEESEAKDSVEKENTESEE